MKKITDLELKEKRVILRCDLNVSISDGLIVNDEKIKASLKTINYLIKQNSKIIIMSHLDKIKKEEDKKTKSLKIVFERLKKLMPDQVIYFSPDTRGPKLEALVNNLKPGEILLIENTRFEDLNANLESSCNEELSKYWASLGEIFINDAFGLTHRKHASNYGISKYLESAYGFLIETEINNLEVLTNPEHPFLIIMGGAKASDKIKSMEALLNKCDTLILGGVIANTFLNITKNVGKSLVSSESLMIAKELVDKFPGKIILPIDVIVERNNMVMAKFINEITEEDYIYDIGPETIKLYEGHINKAKTIFINGTVGMYENSKYSLGTESILLTSSLAKAKVILGGGDAIASAASFGINDFYFMSTGGGATLSYIAKGKTETES